MNLLFAYFGKLIFLNEFWILRLNVVGIFDTDGVSKIFDRFDDIVTCIPLVAGRT